MASSSVGAMSAAQSQLTAVTILCCMCGVPIQHNPTNMCVNCLHENVDITSEVSKCNTIHSCRSCGRFLGPPWQEVDLESKELMIMCLRKVNGLSKLKLVDAIWVWTEPHSMRLKVKLTLQKEIMNGAVVQQATVIEFVIRNQQCKHCEASFAQGAWKAIVQVRQRVSHKRTFFYLEQLILKHEAHSDCIKIVTFRDGMDFYFKDRNQALKFMAFLSDVVPVKTKYSRKLISADQSSNTADFKHSHIVEIAPLCKDDLVLLPRELAAKQSNISPLVLVKKVAQSISMLDPLTAERTDINAEKYWRYSFPAMMSSKQMVKFVVLSVEATLVEQKASARMKRLVLKSNKGKERDTKAVEKTRAVAAMAECVVVRERDLGVNDIQFTCITHLGGLLAPGDTVLGYDLTNANYNVDGEGENVLANLPSAVPDVVLVRKCYERNGERAWTLKKLETEKGDGRTGAGEETDYDADMEDFLQQVEGDKEMRQQMNLYRNSKAIAAAAAAAAAKAASSTAMEDDSDDGLRAGHYDDEEVRLDELLGDMDLLDSEDAVDAADEQKRTNARHMEELRVLSEEEVATSSVFEFSAAAGSAVASAEGDEDI